MVQLTPVNINDGDPVTADTIRTIINNVQLVALGDTSSGVTIGDSLGNSTVIPKTYNDTLASLTAKIAVDKTKGYTGTVSWGANKFTTAPVVTANLQFTSSGPANYKYTVVIGAVTTSGFTYYVIPCAPVSNLSCFLSWIAVGTFSAI
jgi:hypothetical protein